ncbi:MAG: YlxR family protein [Jatrophihabitantaceae bacterium]
MAVRSSTAAESGQAGQPSNTRLPIRTCIGCRKRAAATELLRVVVASSATAKANIGPADEQDQAGGPAGLSVVPDPRHRAPGRGAWLHPAAECVDLAQRRRAFTRALKAAALDPTPVREYVQALIR